MRKSSLLAVLSVLAVACLGLAYWLFDAGRGPNAVSQPIATATTDLPASAVLAINPRRASPASRAPVVREGNGLSREFERAASLRPLYDQLTSAGGPSTPEARYFLFRILSECARAPAAGAPAQTRGERRKAFADAIPDASPDKPRRLARFDELASRCDHLDGLTATEQDLHGMLAEAARAGDPKARAHLVALEILGTAKGPEGPAITDEQLGTLREALRSGDPSAMVIAGTALSNSFRDLVIEIGPQHDEVDGRAAREAWRILGCEYGLECGPPNRELQAACAHGGLCGATTLADHLFYYHMSPHQAQLIDSYRQQFRRVVESNDWGGIRFSRRPNPNGGRTLFAAPR